MISHIVLFTPKADLPDSDMRSFARMTLESLQAIPDIRRAVIGRSMSIDPGYGRVMGHKTYQYAAILEFDSPEALVRYLNHPAHVALGEQFWSLCESTVVLEVDAREPGGWTVDDLV